MSRVRVARKPHTCTLCGEPITVGERHVYQRMTPWDHALNDGFADYRAHERCNEHWLRDFGPECDWEFPIGAEHEFRESRDEHLRVSSTPRRSDPCLAALRAPVAPVVRPVGEWPDHEIVLDKL